MLTGTCVCVCVCVCIYIYILFALARTNQPPILLLLLPYSHTRSRWTPEALSNLVREDNGRVTVRVCVCLCLCVSCSLSHKLTLFPHHNIHIYYITISALSPTSGTKRSRLRVRPMRKIGGSSWRDRLKCDVGEGMGVYMWWWVCDSRRPDIQDYTGDEKDI